MEYKHLTKDGGFYDQINWEAEIEVVPDDPKAQAENHMVELSQLPSKIMTYVSAQPEATPLRPNDFYHLGCPETVNQAMSDLTESGRLSQVCEGIFVQLVETRFGTHFPNFEKVIPHLADIWDETIVPCGGASANVLGMTTQVPVRPVYLTSGPNRVLKIGGQTIELRNAPKWQLTGPNHPAGNAIRALAWLGREEAENAIEMIGQSGSIEELREIIGSCETMPEWITEAVHSEKRT